MPVPEMTLEIGLVFGLIGITVFLFLMDWLRVDVVAICIMILLPIFHLVDGMDAFAGLSSNAVVSIISVLIIGAGLDRTGIVSSAVQPILRLAGTSHTRIVTMLSGTVAVISSVMQNTGAAALFLPAVRRLARETRTPISTFLMPIGFCAILGGTLTLVGSSPLIMLNDLLRPYGLEPFGLFSMTPIGAGLVLTGILYFLLFGRWVLPKPKAPADTGPIQTEADYYAEMGELVALRLPEDATIPEHGIKIRDICARFNLHPVALAYAPGSCEACEHSPNHVLPGRPGFLQPKPALRMIAPPDGDMEVCAGAKLAAYGTETAVAEAAEAFGLVRLPDLDVFQEELSGTKGGVMEAIIPPHSPYVGQTLADIRFRHHYQVAPLALARESQTFYTGLMEQTVHPGDAILMHGTWERFHFLRKHRDFLFARPLDQEIQYPDKAAAAVGSFLLATALVIFTNLPLAVCLMTGALGMVLTRVLTIDEAYRSVDWRTVFLLAGLMPLGVAAEQTHAAAWLAHQVLAIVGSPPPFVFMLTIGAMATAFTLVVSNVGAVVLLVPLVVDMAEQMGTDPRAAALVVTLAASNSFLLPTHQVNALYMGPGGYCSKDYIRAGAPLSVLFLIVLAALSLLWF